MHILQYFNALEWLDYTQTEPTNNQTNKEIHRFQRSA